MILAASTASQTGDWLYNVALLVWVYDATHSAGWVALMTVARLAPYPLFGPLGGLVADTFDRVVYGDEPAGPADVAALDELDRAVDATGRGKPR